ncbi:hypothetical protein M9H77_09016 [Catharanthus roseus]|uniref:Uncharacterized protein n=1 Tax=Catharanthus roseus TaxID=4058 RepID=A0ACC0BZL3_CATRO|nr:hypothetical protein M9H77_09016 [Catharanthus roseus]
MIRSFWSPSQFLAYRSGSIVAPETAVGVAFQIRNLSESWKDEILAEKHGDARSCLTLHFNDKNSKMLVKRFLMKIIIVILLNSLFESFNDVKSAIKYGRDDASV